LANCRGTHAGQKDTTVYNMLKTMYDNEKDLYYTRPLRHSHHSKTVVKEKGTPRHPGAIKV